VNAIFFTNGMGGLELILDSYGLELMRRNPLLMQILVNQGVVKGMQILLSIIQ
jgi:hypothetical protein